jgi:hypothetical protein
VNVVKTELNHVDRNICGHFEPDRKESTVREPDWDRLTPRREAALGKPAPQPFRGPRDVARNLNDRAHFSLSQLVLLGKRHQTKAC